jgi:uncharacterized protein YjiS (DUF1127 family)
MSEHVRPNEPAIYAGADLRAKNEIIAEARRAQAEHLGQLIGHVTDWIGAVLGPFFRHFREAQTMRELASLDDRTLADIGLKREDIPAFVMQGRIVRAEDEPIAAAVTPTPEPPKADAIAIEKEDRVAA